MSPTKRIFLRREEYLSSTEKLSMHVKISVQYKGLFSITRFSLSPENGKEFQFPKSCILFGI
jgi:hypothetical protein